MIPALRLLRKAYPEAHITLASETASTGIVSAREILGGRDLVDEFLTLSNQHNKLVRAWSRLCWFLSMRQRNWDLGIVLIPPSPPTTLTFIRRLKRYLRLCGCKQILAPEAVLDYQYDDDGNLLPMSHVTDQLTAILQPLGIAVPPPLTADSSLPPKSHTCQTLPANHRYLAIGPGANMSSKCWPIDRYAQVLAQLAKRHQVVPVYFCGINDKHACDFLQQHVPGIAVIGHPLEEVDQLMRQCIGYLGNDTGVTHLAAAVGLPCVGIYSNRNPRGLWEPYTQRKGILWPPPCPCAGCNAQNCTRMKGGCISLIQPEEVLEMCEKVIFNNLPYATKAKKKGI